MRKRILSVLLALAMLLTLLPASALAAEEELEEAEPPEAAENEAENEEIPELELIELPELETSALGGVSLWSAADGTVDLASGTHVKWIDRIDVPDQVKTFYATLEEAADNDGTNDWLIDPTGIEPQTVNISNVNTTVYAISVPLNSLDKDYVVACIQEAYSAFDRDHPEVFWLGGRSSILTSSTEVFFVLKLSDENGKSSDIRSEEYQTAKAIQDDIKAVNDAVTAINQGLASDASAYDKIVHYDNWLTHNNGYNTIVGGYEGGTAPADAWECTSALGGRFGTSGPVCEGYARAFKVLCDRAGIGCVLVDGQAVSDPSDSTQRPGPHMWNYAEIDSKWYGVDVTWDDPGSGAKALSGYENTNYLLVGSDTKNSSQAKFIDSHPVSNQVTDPGLGYTNGPNLETEAYPIPNPPKSVTVTCMPEETGTGSGGSKYYPLPEQTALGTDAKLVLTYTAEATNADDAKVENAVFSWSANGYGTDEGFVFAPAEDGKSATLTISSKALAETHPAKGELNGVNVTVSATYKGVTGSVVKSVLKRAEEATFLGPITDVNDGTPVANLTAGNSASYAVKVYDQYGAEMADPEVTWELSPSAPATVNNGTVTVNSDAETNATFTLTAKCESLTTDPLTIKVSALPDQTLTGVKETAAITYGDTLDLSQDVTAGGALSYTVKAGGDVVEVSNTGVVTTKKAGSATVTVTAAGDAGHAAKSVDCVITVNPRPITIKAGDKTITYGDAIPSGFTYSVTAGSVVSGDTLTVTYTCNATNTSTADQTYPIVPVCTDSNYAVTVQNGTLTINKKALTLSGDPASVGPFKASEQKTRDQLITAVQTDNETIATNDASVTVALEWTMTETKVEPQGGTYHFTGTPKLSAEQAKNYTISGTKTMTVTVTAVKAALSLSQSTGTMKASEVNGDNWKPAASVVMKVTYDPADGATPTTLTITNWSPSEDVEEAAKRVVSSQKEATVTLTPTYDALPEWATPVSNEKPTYELTLTAKTPVTVAVTMADATYTGAALTDPKPTITGATIASPKFNFHYTGTALDGTAYDAVAAPKNAGTYKVTATLDDATYSGSAAVDFKITPATVTLTWSDVSNLVYDGTEKTVTATIADGGLVPGDTCELTYTGNKATNASKTGEHYTATAVLGNKNYTAANLTKDYTIAKATRTLTVNPAALTLTPKTTEGTITAAVGANDDKDSSFAGALKFVISGDTTAVTWNKTSKKVTGTGNGVVNIAVSVDATDNYEAVAAETVTVTAVMQPVLGITGVTGDTGDQLTGVLDGKTIKVTGIGSKDAVKIDLDLAVVGSITLSQDPLDTAVVADQGKIAVKNGETVYDEYTVDLSGITEKVEGVDVKAGDSETKSELPADDPKKSEVDAAISTGNTIDGVIESAGEKLQDAGAAEKKDGIAEVEVKVSLNITAKSLKTENSVTTYKIDVYPQYTIAKKDDPSSGPLVEPTKVPNEWLTTEVTVKVKLPKTLADAVTGSAQLFAKHKLANGSYEYLKTTVTDSGADKIASWKMKSFSEVELYTSTKTVTITFQDGDTTKTVTYDESNRNDPLPTNSKGTNKWTIDGRDYTTVAKLLDAESLGSDPITAVPKVEETPVTPPTRPSGGGSSSSGGSSTGRYTVSKVSGMKNGSVSLSTTSAKKGDTVTITPKPDKGYEVDTVTVLDKNGDRVRVREEDGKYTFTMPDGKVTVEATFRKIEDAEPETGFVDVPDGAYYAGAVDWAVEKGITNGTTDTTFSPNAPCTRAQIVTFLWRAAGSPAASSLENPFTDVAPGAYYYDAVLWAVERGITGGTTAATFSPNQACTRAQTVTFLHRYENSPAAGNPENPFTDVPANAYYTGAVLWAVEKGVTGGTTAATFSPNAACTRGQIVTFLYRDMA